MNLSSAPLASLPFFSYSSSSGGRVSPFYAFVYRLSTGDVSLVSPHSPFQQQQQQQQWPQQQKKSPSDSGSDKSIAINTLYDTIQYTAAAAAAFTLNTTHKT